MNCLDGLLYQLLDRKNVIAMSSPCRKSINMVVYLSKSYYEEILAEVELYPMRQHDWVSGNTIHGEVFHVVDDDSHPPFRIFQI